MAVSIYTSIYRYKYIHSKYTGTNMWIETDIYVDINM